MTKQLKRPAIPALQTGPLPPLPTRKGSPSTGRGFLAGVGRPAVRRGVRTPQAVFLGLQPEVFR
jgi:hypothetical protein